MHRRFALLLLAALAACDGGGGDGFGVAMSGDSVTVAPGAVANACIHLESGGQEIAATQNDLGWDPSCLTLVGGCRIEPATGKQLLSNQRGPGQLRSIVISLSDTNPIPDGPLYCCSLRAEQREGCCAVSVSGAQASDPEGRFVAVATSDGEVCIQ